MAKKAELKLKFKVVQIGDYLQKAREKYPELPIRDTALAMLYSENKVIDQVTLKGVLLFVAEA